MGPKIRHRKLTLCPSTADLTVDELTEECPECHQFVLFCCSCNRNYPSGSSERQPPIPCHHFRIVFTDGACLDNGGPNARAGVGMAVGSIEALQLSAPITDAMDPFPVRSNQRAELLAAKEGLRFLAVLAEMIENKSHQRPKGEHRTWIIATDSDYVVRGMTEWLPAWKKRNYLTSKGTPPVNLDLFLALEEEVVKHEKANVKVGFWYIPRRYNGLADSLAKEAAGTL